MFKINLVLLLSISLLSCDFNKSPMQKYLSIDLEKYETALNNNKKDEEIEKIFRNFFTEVCSSFGLKIKEGAVSKEAAFGVIFAYGIISPDIKERRSKLDILSKEQENKDTEEIIENLKGFEVCI